jgi:predicted lipid-binding transport protein (Tim44 family)
MATQSSFPTPAAKPDEASPLHVPQKATVGTGGALLGALVGGPIGAVIGGR